jgi:hypothetical protein
MMVQGDLLYIPRDVLLFAPGRNFRTTKPLTALYLKEQTEHFMLHVLVDGVTMKVRKNHVYPLKEEKC